MPRISIKDTDKKTRDQWLHIWERNAIMNLPAIDRYPSVNDISFPNVPAICIGPGPSLTGALPTLKKAKGRGLLITSQRGVKPLLDYGITPDVVVALDAGDIITEHFIGVDLSNIILCLDYSVDPRLFNLKAKKILTYDGRAKELKWLYPLIENPAHVPSGYTVTATQVGLAVVWGCEPIALVGADLAHDGKDRYGGAAMDGDLPQHKKEKMLMVRGWKKNKQLFSEADLILTRHWLTRAAEKRPHIRFFQCAEKGTYIKGFYHRKLNQLIKIFKLKHDVSKVFDTLKDKEPGYLKTALSGDVPEETKQKITKYLEDHNVYI